MAEFATISIAAAVIIVALVVLAIVLRLTGRGNKSALRGAWGNKSFELNPSNHSALDALPPTIVPAPVTKVSEIRMDSEEPETIAEEPPNDKTDLVALVSAENIHDIDDAWAALDLSKFEEDKKDIWTGYYLGRRNTMGGTGAKEALIAAHTDNPTWIWPAVNLARLSSTVADWDQAEAYLLEALRRATGKNRATIIENLVTHEYKSKGFDEAVEKARAFSNNETNSVVASVIDAILSIDDDNLPKGSLSVQLFRELRQREETSLSQKFSLAYQYSDSDDTKHLGLRTYASLSEAGYSKPTCQNNLGVLYGSFGSPLLQFEHYEDGFKSGSSLAGINLATALANAGFIDRAEELLNNIPPDSESEANRASLISTISSARKKMTEKRKEIRALTLSAYEPYQREISLISAFWKSGTSFNLGPFEGPNACTFDANAGQLKLTRSGKRWSGALTRRGFFFDGMVIEESTTLLLAGNARVIAAPTASDQMTLMIFPALQGSPPEILRLARRQQDEAA